MIALADMLLRLTCQNCNGSGCRMCLGTGHVLKDPYAVTSGEQGIAHDEVELTHAPARDLSKVIWESPPCEQFSARAHGGLTPSRTAAQGDPASALSSEVSAHETSAAASSFDEQAEAGHQ